METIIGRFYFKQTTSLNLLGEFSNNSSDENYVEGAFKTSLERGFEGTYQTKWIENNSIVYILTISSKLTNNSIIYHLEWKNNNGALVYRGQGMIVDNILIGNYDNLKN